MFFVSSRAWDKEKIPSLREESNLRPSDSNALPLSHRDFTVSEVHNEVHLTRVLHTARIRTVDSVMFVGQVNDMVDLRGCPSQKYIFNALFEAQPH